MLVELVQFAHAHHIEAVKPPKSASGGTLPDSLLGADVAPSAAGEAASFDALLFIGQVRALLMSILHLDAAFGVVTADVWRPDAISYGTLHINGMAG